MKIKQLFVLLFFSFVCFYSCKREKERLPVITTSKVAVNYNSATCTAVLYLPGDSKVTEKGFCWSTSKEPTINDHKVICGEGDGNFAAKIDSLKANRNHYVRAYAINKFGISYGSPVKFRPYDGLVTDIDGNVYLTVKIGNQEWLGSNLRVTRYRNGTPINNYYTYNNDSSYNKTYGKLYDWYSVTSSNQIAPVGWHIPTSQEWITLMGYVGINPDKKLKEGFWKYQDQEFTNDVGFGALPGGFKDGYDYTFHNLEYTFAFWFADSYSATEAICYMNNADGNFLAGYTPKIACLSVRCIKD